MPPSPQYQDGIDVLKDLNLAYTPGPGDGWSLGAAPPGWATQVYNMRAERGRVLTRWGTTSVSQQATDVVSIKEYVQQDSLTRKVLILIAGGQLRQAGNTNYTFTDISGNVVEASLASNLRMNSTTAFGREYMAFSTLGTTPVQVPCAYDGNYLRRVAPAGPARAPLSALGAAGQISIGVHKYRIIFRTEWGYLTAPSPFGNVTGDGAHKVDFTGVPLGPSYVTARIICMTAADDEDLFYIPESSMVIEDNVTTTATVDFQDTELLAGVPISRRGEPDSDLAGLIEIPAATSVVRYKGRLGWIHPRNTLVKNRDIGLLAPSFDGGWNVNEPNGWLGRVTGYSQGSGIPDAFGDYLMATGNGTTQQCCLENRSTSLAFLPPGVDIRYRIRIRRDAGLVAGTFHVIPVTDTSAANTATAEPVNITPGPGQTTVNLADVSSSEWRVLDRLFLSAANNKKTQNWRLRVSGGGSGLGGSPLTGTKAYYIDYIELYPANLPTQPSLVWWSRAGQPDAYDGVSGPQYFEQDNGQRARGGFVIGDTCYIWKDRSLISTVDDGSKEPAFWPTSVVSERIGSLSAQGVGHGDQWVAIVSEMGLYYFAGGEPVSLTRHVQFWWDRLFQGGFEQAVCRVDMKRKAIYVVFPLDFVVYTFSWKGNSPIGEVLQFSVHNFFDVNGSGIGLWSAAASLRSDTTEHFLFGIRGGGGAETGKILRIDDSTHADWSTRPIGTIYETSLMGDDLGRKLFHSVRFWAIGQGSLNVNLGAGIQQISVVLKPGQFYGWDIELPETRVVADMMKIQFSLGSAVSGDWFALDRIVVFWTREEQRGRESSGG